MSLAKPQETCHDFQSFSYLIDNCTYLSSHFKTLFCYALVAMFAFEYLLRWILPNFAWFRAIKHDDQIRWVNKIISYIHAWFATIMTGYILMQSEDLRTDFVFGFSELAETEGAISGAYLLYDLLQYFLKYKQLGGYSSMVIHHIACLGSLLYCLTFRIGVFFVMSLLFTEISTPFMQHRWFLATLGKKNSFIYKLNGIAFMFIFLFGRLTVSAYDVYILVFNPEKWLDFPPYVYLSAFAVFLLLILNVYWFFIIVTFVFKGEGKKPAKPAVEGQFPVSTPESASDKKSKKIE